jgi:Ser/Thr protein kinase RdoA (MazF antagonist)
VTVEEAERLAATSFGLKVRARPLGSQQDSNFVLVEPDDRVLGVLKIANPVFTAAEIEAQDAAAEHVAAAGGLRAGTVRAGPVTVPTGDGPALARVLTYLPGGTLTGPGYLSPRVVAEIGAVAGQVSRALRYFTHPGLDRVLQWDLRHADRVVGRLAEHVRDADQRARVTDAAGAAWRRVQAVAADLPRQAVHGDLSGDNLVCTTRHGLRTPDGVIDFGDLTTSWAVGELAVAITSVLRQAGAEPCTTLPAVGAFHRIRPLTAGEAAALWPLVVLRAAVLIVSGEQQAAIDDGNDYVTSALEDERHTFGQAVSVPAEVMTALILDHLGLDGPPLGVPAGKVLDLGSARYEVLDLSVQSGAMDAGPGSNPGGRTGWPGPCWTAGRRPWSPGSGRHG